MTPGKDKPLNADPDSNYRAFLIRCWREGENWHFVLEKIGETRQQPHGFARYDQLASYLESLFFNADDQNSDGGADGAGTNE